jgi:uncharacterized protein
VANELWRLTGKPEYLAWAHRIAFNGFFNGQVANGGFGCSTVAGANGARHVGVSEAAHEAWWCCSMRAAEGFAELVSHALYSQGANLYVAGLNPGTIDTPLAGGRLAAAASGGYPYEGRWTLDVHVAPDEPIVVHFFVPPWGVRPVVTVNGNAVEVRTAESFATVALTLKAGDRLAYAFEQGIYAQPPVNRHSLPGHVTYNYGPLVLALPPGAAEIVRLPPVDVWCWDPIAGCAVCPGSVNVLAPLGERFRLADPDLKRYARQMLFETES